MRIKKIKSCCSEFGISPIKLHRVSKQNKPAHMKRKISQVTNVVTTKVAKLLHVEKPSEPQQNEKQVMTVTSL